jgi:hypothetical protein
MGWAKNYNPELDEEHKQVQSFASSKAPSKDFAPHVPHGGHALDLPSVVKERDEK